MFTVHGTKKLLDRCGGASPGPAPTTTVLGDWYATVLFWKPQVALFVNELTRLPVLVPLAPVSGLVPRFVVQVAAVFDLLGIDPRFTAAEVAEMAGYGYAKTINRSVVGSLKEASFFAGVHRGDLGDDLLALSLRLASIPCGPLRGSHGFPDKELHAVVAASLS